MSIAIDCELRERLLELAKRNERSASGEARRALRRYLLEEESR